MVPSYNKIKIEVVAILISFEMKVLTSSIVLIAIKLFNVLIKQSSLEINNPSYEEYRTCACLSRNPNVHSSTFPPKKQKRVTSTQTKF